MNPRTDDEKTALAMALLDGLADQWFAQSGFALLDLPPSFIRVVKQAHAEGIYAGRCSAIDAHMPLAIRVENWRPKTGEPVLLYVVHANAQFEPNDARRRAEWETWCFGYWTEHNLGGWVWEGLCGTVTHVARLPKVQVA